MTSGPFNLSGAAGTPTLTADLWLSSEPNYDLAKLLVSTDGSSYYGNVWWGSSEGAWVGVELDLTNVYVLGDVSHAPALYVMLAFTSDATNAGYEGAYFDNVLLATGSTPPGSPTISSISPGEASAGTDSHVTISGSGFGASAGKVEFSYGRNGVTRISGKRYLVVVGHLDQLRRADRDHRQLLGVGGYGAGRRHHFGGGRVQPLHLHRAVRLRRGKVGESRTDVSGQHFRHRQRAS